MHIGYSGAFNRQTRVDRQKKFLTRRLEKKGDKCISFFLSSFSTIMNPFQSITTDQRAQDQNTRLIELEDNLPP
jgi:hypothetical protein